MGLRRHRTKPKRAGGFKTDGLIFVKTVKREQDFRFDVPVFGLRTLEIVAEQNIRTAVLKAGSITNLETDSDEATSSRTPNENIGSMPYLSNASCN